MPKDAKAKRGRPLKGSAPRTRMSFTLPRELHDAIKKQSLIKKTNVSEMIEASLSQSLVGATDAGLTLSMYAKIRNDLAHFSKQHGIKKLSLFGSMLNQTASSTSDIDLLVEFDPDQKCGLFQLIELESELSKLFANRKVDLRTSNDLSKYFRETVQNEALVLYGS